jgi:hypothetical protein
MLFKKLILLLIVIYTISCETNMIRDQLIGKWEGKFNKNFYVEFTENGFYLYFPPKFEPVA